MRPFQRFLRIIPLILLFVFCLSPICLGNSGLPMIMVTMPLILAALIPVIIVETLVFWHSFRREQGVPGRGKVFLGVSLANLISTAAGYPLSWVIGLILEVILSVVFGIFQVRHILPGVLGFAWMMPGSDDTVWNMVIAAILGLIPAFFVSVFIEYRSLKRVLTECKDQRAIKSLVWKANILSYCLLALFFGGYIFFTSPDNPVERQKATQFMKKYLAENYPGENFTINRLVFNPNYGQYEFIVEREERKYTINISFGLDEVYSDEYMDEWEDAVLQKRKGVNQ